MKETRTHWLSLTTALLVFVGAACGGGSSGIESNAGISTTGPTGALPTRVIHLTATPVLQILTFDEIGTQIAGAYQATQVPAELCDISLMNYQISHAKNARDAYDKAPIDFSPYANSFGRLVEEIQKIADATHSDDFANLQKTLEASFIADLNVIGSRGNASQNDLQNFLAIWRSNNLDRNRSDYNASTCGIILPKQ